MGEDRKRTQAMPEDGRKGAPDGVNTQGKQPASRASGEQDGKEEPSMKGPLGHGGQSVQGYHGSGQLGSREVRPGGNRNAGAKED